MAGALGLALAGPRHYADGIVDDPWLGGGTARATTADIGRALRLYHAACLLLSGGLILAPGWRCMSGCPRETRRARGGEQRGDIEMPFEMIGEPVEDGLDHRVVGDPPRLARRAGPGTRGGTRRRRTGRADSSRRPVRRG